jgi:hypothetical protein
VQVIASTPAVAQIEVVVVVTELYPSYRRSTPPFLVSEVDLVGQARFTLLTGDDQVNHELPNASVLAEVTEVDPTETIEAHPELVATLAICMRRQRSHAYIVLAAG